MPDLPFTFPNGVRGILAEDGKINLLGKAPTGNEPANATPRPSGQSKNQTDEELGIDSGLAVPSGRTVPSVDSGSQPLSELRPTPESDAPLEREDPIGDTIIGGSLAKPVGAVAGKVVGAAVGRAAPVLAKITRPSLTGAAEGAAVSGVPTLIHTGDPIEALKAAGKGAVAGAVFGHVASSAASRALREKAEAAGAEAAQATKAAEAIEHQASGGQITPTVHEHLTTLAGSAGPAGVAALKEVALKPTIATIQEAVKAGVPAYIALQVARLGAAQVAP